MSRPILCTIALSAAVAAAIYGAGAFVTPRGVSKTPVPPQLSAAASPEFTLDQGVQAPVAEEAAPSFAKWVGTGLMVGVLAAVLSAPAAMAADPTPQPADAPPGTPLGRAGRPEGYGNFFVNARTNRDKLGFIKGLSVTQQKNLEPCSKSKKFAKIMKDQLFKITKRRDKFPKGSIIYERLQDKIALTKKRQEAYGGRWCSKFRGLPYVITTGENVRGGVVIPALGFLYITGWIGWSGRTYLRRTRDMQKEIQIDVPLALSIMASGYAWPVLGWQDIVNGKMAVPESDFKRGGWAHWEYAPGYGPVKKSWDTKPFTGRENVR